MKRKTKNYFYIIFGVILLIGIIFFGFISQTLFGTNQATLYNAYTLNGDKLTFSSSCQGSGFGCDFRGGLFRTIHALNRNDNDLPSYYFNVDTLNSIKTGRETCYVEGTIIFLCHTDYCPPARVLSVNIPYKVQGKVVYQTAGISSGSIPDVYCDVGSDGVQQIKSLMPKTFIYPPGGYVVDTAFGGVDGIVVFDFNPPIEEPETPEVSEVPETPDDTETPSLDTQELTGFALWWNLIVNWFKGLFK